MKSIFHRFPLPFLGCAKRSFATFRSKGSLNPIRQTVKIILHPVLILMALVAGAEMREGLAQIPAPTITPRLTREEAIQRALERAAAADAKATNAPAASTDKPAPPATNASTLITNRTLRTATPAPVTPAPAPAQANVAAQPAPPPAGGFPAVQVQPQPNARPAGGLPIPAAGAPVAGAPVVGAPALGANVAVPANAGNLNLAGKGEEEVLPPGLIKFLDTPLDQVLDVYQELTGRTVLRPNNLPQTKVTIRSETPLTRKEAIQALDSILSMNQVTMVPQGEKFVKAVPFSQAPTEGSRFSKLSGPDLPEAGVYVTHVVQVKNATLQDVATAMQQFSKMPNSILAIPSSNIIILRDYAENVKRMLEVLDKIDIVPLSEYESIVIPIKYALAGDIAQVLGSLTTGGGGGVTSVGTRPQTERRGLTAPGMGVGGVGGAGGFQGQGGYNQNASTTGLGAQRGSQGNFQDRLRGIVNKAASAGDIEVLGQTKIIADERTNSLLIFASKADIATIKDIISKLDVVLAQVLIEAIIMEVTLGDDLRYGFSYLQKTPSQAGNYYSGIGAIKNNSFLTPGNFGSGATNALLSGFNYFGRFGGDFDMTATAIATDSRINVLSRPRIQTSHAVQARIFVGESRPYITGTSGGFSGYTQSQYSQLRIGIDLSVTPLINPDGLVVMDIEQQINSVGANVKIDNNDVPTTVERTASAKVSVRDRETIILGGFISSSKDKSSSGVPLLKDIPILGALFRSTTLKKNRQELIILIRPTVLPTPGDASLAAIEERSKMPGILHAEKEMREDEKQRRAQAAKELFKREGLGD